MKEGVQPSRRIRPGHEEKSNDNSRSPEVFIKPSFLVHPHHLFTQHSQQLSFIGSGKDRLRNMQTGSWQVYTVQHLVSW